jgi:trk system potassium uptake protein TrkH
MGSLAVVALVGRMVALFALLMLVPDLFALSEHDEAEDTFITATLVTFCAGVLMSMATRRFRRELQPRDGFVLVALKWLVLPAFGALPLFLAVPGISATNAYFEAMSAFTTTGATALVGLDQLPLSVSVWRCFMMWVGGLGIIVLAVAILPLLGVGGSQLYKAQAAGPLKDQKLTPRIADTARVIWLTYGLLSLACFLAYRAAGMTWTEAFMHMNTTVSPGGFSSYDASFGKWNSPEIEAVAIVFMLLSGVSLLLYYSMWRARSLLPLLRNAEALAFYAAIAGSVVLIAGYLVVFGTYASWAEALRHTAFQVVSVATTTGYANHDYAQWPLFAPLMMILLGCFVTCASSTGAAAVLGARAGDRLHRGGRVCQQHRPGPGRSGAGGQLRGPQRLPDLGVHLCDAARPAGAAGGAGLVHAAVLEEVMTPLKRPRRLPRQAAFSRRAHSLPRMREPGTRL